MKDNAGENVSLSKKQELNNRIVLMRKCVRTGKIYVINKLSREAKKLKLRKGDEKGKEKAKRKAEKYIEEIHAIRKLNVDTISRFALQNKFQLNQLLVDPKATNESRAMARLAFSPPIQSEVEKYRKVNPYWEMQIEVLLQRGRSVKKLEYEHMKEERARKKELKRKQREAMGIPDKDQTVNKLLSALRDSRDEDEDITVESQSEDDDQDAVRSEDEDDNSNSDSDSGGDGEDINFGSDDLDENVNLSQEVDEDSEEEISKQNNPNQSQSSIMFKGDKMSKKTGKNEKMNKEMTKLNKKKAEKKSKQKPMVKEKKIMNLNKAEGEMRVKQLMNLEELEDEEDKEEVEEFIQKCIDSSKGEKKPRSNFFVGGTEESEDNHNYSHEDSYDQERKFLYKDNDSRGFRGRGRGDFNYRGCGGRGNGQGNYSRGGRGNPRDGDRGFSGGRSSSRGFSGDRGSSRGFSRDGNRGISREGENYSRGGRNEFRGGERGNFQRGFNRGRNESRGFLRGKFSGGNEGGGLNHGKFPNSEINQKRFDRGLDGMNKPARYFEQREKSSNLVKKPTETLHPSWEAKKKQTTITAFKGKKIKFDD